MAVATVTSKGQVTIPREVRKALGLKKHDQVLFFVQGRTALLMPVEKVDLLSLFGCLPATRPYPGEEAVWEEVGQALARGEV